MVSVSGDAGYLLVKWAVPVGGSGLSRQYETVDVIYLNFNKAFDTISWSILGAEFEREGLKSKIGRLMETCLSYQPME